MTSRVRIGWLQRGFLTLGIALLAAWTWTALGSRGFQSEGEKQLAAALRDAASGVAEAARSDAAFARVSAPVRAKRAGSPGRLLGRIEIPRLGIAAVVADGADAKTLRHAVGHIRSTAFPGTPGNCGLAGHRDTFFRGLGRVRTDDLIRIATPTGTYTYEVEWTLVVAPHRVDVLDSTDARSLTLVTCYPFSYIGHAPKRFIVRARQVAAVTTSGSRAPEDPIVSLKSRL